MPDPNRPLSEGKIAVLKRLKLAYDDALDAGQEPAQFAPTKDELLSDSATASDLRWLQTMRYVEHVQEVTRDGEPRRQLRAAMNHALSQNSCFFLTYLGNTYVERNGLHRRAASKRKSPSARKRKPSGDDEADRDETGVTRRAASSRDSRPQSGSGERELPAWDAADGNLCWCGKVILRLATWADAERAMLDEFERRHWESPIPNPIPRDATRDPTQSRRNAVYNLNRHFRSNRSIEFFCLGGDFMGWRPCA